MAICAVVQTIKRRKAHAITVQAHAKGVAVVVLTWKEKAKQYSVELQQYGLTSSIRRLDE